MSRNMAFTLSSKLVDVVKGGSDTIYKKEETHRVVEVNTFFNMIGIYTLINSICMNDEIPLILSQFQQAYWDLLEGPISVHPIGIESMNLSIMSWAL